tara:strand:- start:1637 stop:1822 length:186 start_codon:yes stop_codon:yes gene_type:complete
MQPKKLQKNSLSGTTKEALAHDKGYVKLDDNENFENDPKGARLKGLDHTGFLGRSHISTER